MGRLRLVRMESAAQQVGARREVEEHRQAGRADGTGVGAEAAAQDARGLARLGGDGAQAIDRRAIILVSRVHVDLRRQPRVELADECGKRVASGNQRRAEPIALSHPPRRGKLCNGAIDGRIRQRGMNPQRYRIRVGARDALKKAAVEVRALERQPGKRDAGSKGDQLRIERANEVLDDPAPRVGERSITVSRNGAPPVGTLLTVPGEANVGGRPVVVVDEKKYDPECEELAQVEHVNAA